MTPRLFLKIGEKLMTELMARGPKHIIQKHHIDIFRDYIHVAYGFHCDPIGVCEGKVWTNDCQWVPVPKVEE